MSRGVESLCETCRWMREVVSGTGSRFLLCRLAAEDARYRKYPAQPVVRCEGWEKGDVMPGLRRPRGQSAKELRKDATFPERLLWSVLRRKQLRGLRFRRQHAIGPYIVDFYCPKKRLVIEIDGRSHDDRGAYDLRRERYLTNQGYAVLRVANDDVLDDLEAVAAGILKACGISIDG